MRTSFLALPFVVLIGYQVLRPAGSRPADPIAATQSNPPASSPSETPARADAADLDAALAARVRGWSVSQFGYRRGGALRVPADFHRLSQPIDLRNTIHAYLAGETASAVVYAEWNDDRPTVDLTGAMHVVMRDLTVRSTGGVALRCARREDGASSGWHRFENVQFEGPVLIEASEGNLWIGCTFRSNDTRPALTLRNGPSKEKGNTMQSQTFIGCQFINHAGGPAIVLDNDASVLTDISFVGGDVAVNAPTKAACILRAGLGLRMISMTNMRWEVPAARDAIRIENSAAVTEDAQPNVHGIAIRDCTFYQAERLVHAPRSPLHGCVFHNVTTASLGRSPWGDAEGRRPLLDASLTNCDVRLLNSFLPLRPEPGTFPATHDARP